MLSTWTSAAAGWRRIALALVITVVAVLASVGIANAQAAPPAAAAAPPPGNGSARRLAEVERQHLLDTLAATNWTIEGERGAAALLGLRPSTLRSRMKKLGVSRPGA